MLKKIPPVLIIMLLILSSCSRVGETEIRSVRSLHFIGMESSRARFEAGIEVYNPSKRNITVTSIDTRLVVNHVYIGRLTSDADFRIPRLADTTVIVPFTLRLTNIFTGAAVLSRLSHTSSVEVEVQGIVTARIGLLQKKIKIDRTVHINPSEYRNEILNKK